jgi:predicted nucleic acid-binding protein
MIVFDASTLILVAKVELLDIFLAGIRRQAAIPGEVARECCGVKKTLDALRIQKAIEESRIKVMAANNKKFIAKLQADFSLGKGEAEAVALAFKEKALFLGIDDKNGINACKLLGIAFTTAVGILVWSREKRLIDQASALSKLTTLAQHGRYKSSIIEDARLRMEAKE